MLHTRFFYHRNCTNESGKFYFQQILYTYLVLTTVSFNSNNSFLFYINGQSTYNMFVYTFL